MLCISYFCMFCFYWVNMMEVLAVTPQSVHDFHLDVTFHLFQYFPF